MTYELFVFDLDGTLVDSLPDIASALNHALTRHGYQAVGLDVVRSLVGDGVSRLVGKAQALQPRADAPATEPIVRDLIAFYEAQPCVQTRPYDGIPETLAALQSRGKRLAVLTNKPAEVARALLAHLRLADTFALVVGDGDGLPRKPDPRALQVLCERLGTPLRRAVMIGDGVPDIQVANAAGTPSGAALWGYSTPEQLTVLGPTHVLVRPADVLGIA